MNKLYLALAYGLGAASGIVSTVLYFKKKNSKVPDDADIVTMESVRSKHQQKENDLDNTSGAENLHEEYDHICYDNGYTNTKNENKGDEKLMSKPKPYVISPAEFGDDETHETETLLYFDDGILTDSEYIPIEDVERMVGSQALTTFGMYEEDAVYVRNDEHLMDYEILRDLRKYRDVASDPPEEG